MSTPALLILNETAWKASGRVSIRRRRHALHKGGSVEIRTCDGGEVFAVLVAEKLDPEKLTAGEREEIAALFAAETAGADALQAQKDRSPKQRRTKRGAASK